MEFAVVDSPIGAYAVAWGEAGIVGSWMHAGTAERARQQVLRSYPGAVESEPPALIEAVIADVCALLAGEPRDLLAADLDMTGVPDFDRRVYEYIRHVGPGSTVTYGEVARALAEEPMMARDVGVAMARNRFAPIVPCHRVVAAGGRLGGYSAPGSVDTKRRLLEIEGVRLADLEPVQQQLFSE